MRHRTADEGHILQSGEANIGNELAAPAHQAIVFLARQPRADALPGAGNRPVRKIALVAH
jgi:hypothetical protein